VILGIELSLAGQQDTDRLLKSIRAKIVIDGHQWSVDLMARYKSLTDARPKDRYIWSVDYG
jgi:hypothetical protein